MSATPREARVIDVTDVSKLDGWADLPPGIVTMQVLDVDRND